MINENWAYAAAALNLIGVATYIADVFRGKARPNRVSWAIMSAAPLIAFAAMMTQGVGLVQGAVTLSSGLAPLAIFISTFLVSHPAWQIKRFDLVCGGLSVAGLVMWLATGQGNVAIVFSILADGMAFLPTLTKAYTHPDSESPWAFMFGIISTIIGLFALTSFDFEHSGFMWYLLLANSLAVLLIYFRLGEVLRGIKKS